jgi:hypothetical protein
MKWPLLATLSGVVVLSGSCAHEDPPKPSSRTQQEVCFQRQVLPIFTSYCSRVEGGCHDAGNPRVALVEYTSIMNGIQEGNADGSWFYHVIGRGMPPGAEPQLNSDQLDILRQWIDQGAKNSNCEEAACDSTHVRYTGNIDHIFTDYCNGCHNSTVYPNPRSFSTLDLIRKAVLADPERFLRSIRYDAGSKAVMPPTFQMNDCDLHKIEAWVNNGMPE